MEGYFEQRGAKVAGMHLKGKCDEALYLERYNEPVQCLWKARPLLKEQSRFVSCQSPSCDGNPTNPQAHVVSVIPSTDMLADWRAYLGGSKNHTSLSS